MSILNMNAERYRSCVQADRPVLVEFSAPWCGYCRRLAPALEAVAEEYQDMLAFGAVDIDEEPELARAAGIEVVPTLLLYQSGQVLGSVTAPESREQLVTFIRETLGRRVRSGRTEEKVHDMIVVGGGPGGYTAALYAARAGLDVIVLEKLSAGGQMALTERIDNYPGFENGIGGFDLGERMRRSAEGFGAGSRLSEVLSLELSRPVKQVITGAGTLRGKTVVVATGAGPRELGLAGEKELVGKGVHYCAACDGMFYRDQTVAVVGGGNSAAADALILSRICRRVILIHRRDTLRAEKIYRDALEKAGNVEFRWDSAAVELLAGEKLIGIRLRGLKTGEECVVPCGGVFISVGRKPSTELVRGQLDLDGGGYIAADESTRTNIPGVFAVGDVRTKALRQVVTAVADGAVAVHYAEEYLTGGV